MPLCRTLWRSQTGGWREAMHFDAALARGLSTHAGHLTNTLVSEDLGMSTATLEAALAV
ncbi:hypothetical protein [Microbacterium sp. LMC-P-041]|uniref:hypothetical protein n=1 Tax=Microbacterium sp. LMC-P-041 TaxID=3040293 RepID=UPI002554261B|nr:hypothetical protein [Microbacterium sp. LMC-P-041]